MSLLIPDGAAELRQLQERLRRQHNKHLAVAARIAQALESLDEAITYLELEDEEIASPSSRSHTPSVPGVSGATPVAPYAPLRPTGWERRLQGMTQMEALIAIAEDNGGMVKATDARDILVRSRLAKGQPKNVATTVHHLLGSSDEFEKLSPGVYQLKSMRRSNGRLQPEDEDPPAGANDDIVVLRPLTATGEKTPPGPFPVSRGATLVWEDDFDQLDAGADGAPRTATHGQGFDVPRSSRGGGA